MKILFSIVLRIFMGHFMNDTAISITRDITCLKCGHNGLMDIHAEKEDVGDSLLFLSLGHNPFSGDLHYQCPACDIVLLVDPMLALGEKPVRGVPLLQPRKKELKTACFMPEFIGGLLARVFPGGGEEYRLF